MHVTVICETIHSTIHDKLSNIGPTGPQVQIAAITGVCSCTYSLITLCLVWSYTESQRIERHYYFP